MASGEQEGDPKVSSVVPWAAVSGKPEAYGHMRFSLEAKAKGVIWMHVIYWRYILRKNTLASEEAGEERRGEPSPR